MDKRHLVTQLCEQIRASARVAARASLDAADEAQEGATAQEKREDGRVAIEFAGLARGQDQRARRAEADLSLLEAFETRPLGPAEAICIGAVVEVEDADSGEGRTFFLAPVGAGNTLTGPDGDGYLSVVTPASPLGRAVLGRRVGDIVDVTVGGECREWRIDFAC